MPDQGVDQANSSAQSSPGSFLGRGDGGFLGQVESAGIPMSSNGGRIHIRFILTRAEQV